MASTGKIDDLVSQDALGQLDALLAKLGVTRDAMSAATDQAIKLNAAIGDSKTFTEYNQNAEKAQKSIENMRLSEIRLQQAREKAFDDYEKNLVKQQAAQDKATAAAAKANGEYQKLLDAYNKATLAARNAGVQFGANSDQFIQAADKVKGLRTQLDSIDQPLGNFQRNVGNYGNAITGAFSKAFGYVRQLAYILPGIGIAGIFSAIGEGILFAADKLGVFTAKVDYALTDFEKLGKAAADAAIDESAKLQTLYEASQNLNIPLSERQAVVAQLQKDYPAYFANLDKEAILAGKAQAAYENLTRSIVDRAVVTAFQKNIEDLTKPLAELIQQQETAYAKYEKQREDFFKKTGRALPVTQTFGVIDQTNKQDTKGTGALSGSIPAQLETIDQYKKRLTDKINEAKAGLQQALQDFGINALLDPDKNTKNNKGNKQSDTSLLNERLQAVKVIEDLVLSSQKATDEERMQAIYNFEKDSEKIILDGEKAKVLTQLEASNKAAEIEKTGQDQRNKVLQDALKRQLEINKANEAARRAEFETNKAGEKAREDLIQNASNEELLQLDLTNSQKVIKLAEQYSNGLMTERQYNARLNAIRKQSAAEGIDIQIAALEQIAGAQAAALALGFGSKTDLQNTTNKITGLKIQSNNLKADAIASNAKTNKGFLTDEQKQKAQDILAFSEQAVKGLDIVQGLIDANAQAKIDALEKEYDLIQRNADADKTRVQNSILSDKEKQRQSALIDAQTAQQRIRITNQENEVKKKQAEFDKAAAIARIIQQTAVAVVQALTVPVIGIALAATIGALGAAQLAVAIASPLPQFYKGTKNAPEGFAHVGERGTELQINPDGGLELTPNRDTVKYLQKGTQIIPNHELMAMLAKPEPVTYVGGTIVDNRKLEKLLEENNNLQRKKQPVNVHVHADKWSTYANRNY